MHGADSTARRTSSTASIASRRQVITGLTATSAASFSGIAVSLTSA
ncbi:hypothetical protein [Streptomyces clavuligerus]|nr:hypothetical protein [Streptomyces clavuligerus]MBY6307498.1 hypothetical protein [Streptomyces clavuligerus]WDN56651.1 hypothetical protein LL058_33060 [Streptomyces clavuligerus]